MNLRLQGELNRAQEALKAARSESARRLRELQQLQSSQATAAVDSGLKHQLESETASKEAAQEKLRDTRASLARHKQLVSELRCKVERCCLCPLQLTLRAGQLDPLYTAPKKRRRHVSRAGPTHPTVLAKHMALGCAGCASFYERVPDRSKIGAKDEPMSVVITKDLLHPDPILICPGG